MARQTMPATKLPATKLPRPQVTALCVQLRLKRRRAAEAEAAAAVAAVEAASAASGAELATCHSAGSAGGSADTTAATTAGDTAATAGSASHMLPAALLLSVIQPSGLSSTEEATEQYSPHMSNRLTSSGAAMGQHGSGSEAKGSQPTPWSLHGSVAMEMLRAASAKEPSLKRDDPDAPRAALAQTLVESVVDKRAHATSRQLRRLQDPEEDGVLLEALVDGRAQATSSCIRPRGPINPRQIAVRLGSGGGGGGRAYMVGRAQQAVAAQLAGRRCCRRRRWGGWARWEGWAGFPQPPVSAGHSVGPRRREGGYQISV